jgi:hypothetical protein
MRWRTRAEESAEVAGSSHGAAAALIAAALCLRAPFGADAESVELAAVAGLGFDWETAESSPTRLTLGLSLSDHVLDMSLLADCGVPWEPSIGLRVEMLAVDLEALRVAVLCGTWLRLWADAGSESGVNVGARAEVGPRFLALAAAGGIAVRLTRHPAIGASLRDSFPWARVGVAWRPIPPSWFELAIGSDAPLALWLRTSFELSGSWKLASGVGIEGLLAARYTDFFTLTSLLDGFDVRVAVLIPIARVPK